MTRTSLAPAFAALSLVLSLACPLGATDWESLFTLWELRPEVDRPHPNNVTLALLASRDTTVTSCELEFSHRRRRLDLEADGSEEIALPKGGKMKVDLHVATAAGLTALETHSVKVGGDHWAVYPGRQAWVGWVDPSGIAGEADDRYPYVDTDSFPLELESGDVLLFSVKFTGAPEVLGIERTETHLRRDQLELWAACSHCGSNDTPCPRWW